MKKMLRKWVVNDYFTPSIKAEVILDTLLTPYIDKMVNQQLGLHTVFVTKEMSIPDGDHFGSNAPKIDYVLASRETVYLVELKTTDSSINEAQTENYRNNCQGKLFGECLGRQLLSLLDKPKDTFTLNLGDPSVWNDEMMRTVFQTIITKPFDLFHFSPNVEVKEGEHAKKAQELIRKNKWAQLDKYRSRKYLYTLGQLVDHLDKDKSGLWNKPMEVLYLTPNGGNGKTFPNISLRQAVADLQPEPGDGEFVKLLQSIITAIYPTEETPLCQN